MKINLTANYLQKIDAEVKKEVDAATNKAKTEKEIGFEELTADVYSLALEPEIRNILPNEPLKHIRVGPAKNLK